MVKAIKRRTKEPPKTAVYDHTDDKEMFRNVLVKISELEHELAMRKQRTDRLIAAMFDISTSASKAVSPASLRHDQTHHEGTAIEGSSGLITSDGKDEIKNLSTNAKPT